MDAATFATHCYALAARYLRLAGEPTGPDWDYWYAQADRYEQLGRLAETDIDAARTQFATYTR